MEVVLLQKKPPKIANLHEEIRPISNDAQHPSPKAVFISASLCRRASRKRALKTGPSSPAWIEFKPVSRYSCLRWCCKRLQTIGRDADFFD
jgi:hypothetical protein